MLSREKLVACIILSSFLVLPYFINITALGNQTNTQIPRVTINIEPYSIIYEGCLVNCTVTGNPTLMYWKINDGPPHHLFYENNPIIFDPEPTPLDDEYVNLTVYVENELGSDSDSVEVTIKRLFFGDIHFHSTLSDGKNTPDTMYQNAINDNYLDFVCLTDHAELLDRFEITSPNPIRDILQLIINKILKRSEWQIIKNKAEEYYNPGKFTTFLGYEWSASAEFPGGEEGTPYDHEDVSHVNFYYRDVYPEASVFSATDVYTYDDIFQKMSEEYDKGYLNIGFPHHPLIDNGLEINTVNWTCLANCVTNVEARDKILRGVETYSCWGNAVGQFSNIPITWPYSKKNLYNQTDAWVENAMWEWSDNERKGTKFAMIASSDIHYQSRPGSAKSKKPSQIFSFQSQKPAGLIAVYAVHNTRGEIWDAMNNCSMYGTQLLKIRANARFDDQLAYGTWINCSSPLQIEINAQSTFSGIDRSGKSMCPDSYSSDELDYPIQDIWLIKKDSSRGRPWCKVINHTTPNSHTAVVTFEDYDVQPNDFYYVAIRQKGQDLRTIFDLIKPGGIKDEYMAFIGPVFIDQVIE